MSYYGQDYDLWFIGERGNETKYPAMAFHSQEAAISYAREHCQRYKDFAVYKARLTHFIELGDPMVITLPTQKLT